MSPAIDLGKPMTQEDYRAVLRGTAAFLLEEKRGLMKFVHIVENRHVQ